MHPKTIYLDHNATTPIDPRVVSAMVECYHTLPANPASQHQPGQTARRRLEAARDEIGRLLGARLDTRPADQVIFTSGATEANNLAMRGLVTGATGYSSASASALLGKPAVAPENAGGAGQPSGEIVISAIEHPSVAGVAEFLATQGFTIKRLSVSPNGVVRVNDLPALLTPQTRLVAVMLGNNETGAMQPVAEVAAICRAAGVPLHTDAAQVAGKLPVDFRSLGAATMSVSAHKFHGPRGVGALIVRGGTSLAPLLYGGFQQAELRPGSEPVALPVGMAKALTLWQVEADERIERMTALRDLFESELLAGWPEIVVHARAAPRLPHTSHLGFPGLDRQALLMALDLAGVACSAGSSCASGSSELSPVLVAMGVDEALAGGSLRFSLGAFTTREEVLEAARRILRICNDLRGQKQRRKRPLAAPRREEKML